MARWGEGGYISVLASNAAFKGETLTTAQLASRSMLADQGPYRMGGGGGVHLGPNCASTSLHPLAVSAW